jgi:hypothetical protein
MSRSEESTVSTPKPMMEYSISPTREDLEDQRRISFKICTMESKP